MVYNDRPTEANLMSTTSLRRGHYYNYLIAQGADPDLAQISADLVAAGDACAEDIDEFGLNAVLLTIHTCDWSEQAASSMWEGLARYWASAGGWLVGFSPRVGVVEIGPDRVQVLVTFSDETDDPQRACNELVGVIGALVLNARVTGQVTSAEYDQDD